MQDRGLSPVVLPLASKARGSVPEEGVGVPDLASAPRSARTSTPTLPREPRAEEAEGVSVTVTLLTTRSAITPTPPRGMRRSLRKVATMAKEWNGVPGVGQVVLPPRLKPTSDTPADGRSGDGGNAGARTRGMNSGRCRTNMFRALRRHFQARVTVGCGTTLNTFATDSITTRHCPHVEIAFGIFARARTFASHGMAMALLSNFLSRAQRRLR